MYKKLCQARNPVGGHTILRVCFALRPFRPQEFSQREGFKLPDFSASDREAFASLATTRIEHMAATFGGHAFTETVRALAVQIGRLKCPFHVITPLM